MGQKIKKTPLFILTLLTKAQDAGLLGCFHANTISKGNVNKANDYKQTCSSKSTRDWCGNV